MDVEGKDKELPYKSYQDLRDKVTMVLYTLINRAKGTCITFTSKRIAVMAGLPPQPVLLTIIKDILDEYKKVGFLDYYSKTSHGTKYIITNESPLWKEFKKGAYPLKAVASKKLIRSS